MQTYSINVNGNKINRIHTIVNRQHENTMFVQLEKEHDKVMVCG